MVKSLRRANINFKSNERMLGDSDFVERVLKAAEKSLEMDLSLSAK